MGFRYWVRQKDTNLAEALVAEAEVDKDIIAIHAAMLPVTFASGLACEGRPETLTVRFTHPSCGGRMISCFMMWTCKNCQCDSQCFRYPRGNHIGVELQPGNKSRPLEIGKGRILLEGERRALLVYGMAVHSCLAAASLMEPHGLRLTVADARFCEPLDGALIRSLIKSHEVLITVEEGSIGGYGSHVAQFMALDGMVKWKPMVLPDRYIDHWATADQLAEAGLTPRT